jgi:hypothetical protein
LHAEDMPMTPADDPDLVVSVDLIAPRLRRMDL